MSGLGLSELTSRTVRTDIAGENGVRSIVSSGNEPQGLWGRITDFFGFLFGSLIDFGGWLLGWIGSAISFTFTDIWGLIVSTSTFIYEFDWNQTDEDLDARLQGMRNALTGMAGGTLGRLTGWLACGIVPSAGIFAFNEPLGLYLLRNVGEEALDDLLSELEGLIRASLNLTIQADIITRFKNTRQAIKKWSEEKDSEDWEIQLLNRLFGQDIQRLIDVWGSENAKPWSFQKGVEDRIDDIENPTVRNFIEEFIEELADSCVEAGYVLAQGLDSWVLQNRMQRDELLGPEQVIEVTPDRENEEEKFFIAGGENLVKSQIPQTLSNYQLVENRDIGQWVGETIRDSTRADPSELTVRLMLYSRKTPPYSKAEQSATITLHDFKRSKLDWETIKRAVGWTNGYMYGRFRATAKLDSGRQLVIYASTENEAENRIYELEKLIDPEIQALSISEEKRSGARANGRPLQKQPIRIYPAYMYIQSKQRILNESTNERGFQTLDGTWNTRRFTIELFPAERPDDFEQVVQQALATPGTDN